MNLSMSSEAWTLLQLTDIDSRVKDFMTIVSGKTIWTDGSASLTEEHQPNISLSI